MRQVMRPVYKVEVERVSDAPASMVIAKLRDFRSYSVWHPTIQDVKEGKARFWPLGRWSELRVDMPEFHNAESLTLGLQAHLLPGLVEESRYRVWVESDGTHIQLKARLKGWLALMLMGPYRFKSENQINRLVESL